MKKIFRLTTICLILILLVFSFTSANGIMNEESKKLLLDSSSLEVSLRSSLDLIINLSEIPYENFKIELSSNVALSEPSIENSDTLDTTLDESNTLLEIVGDKTFLSFDNLTLNYTIPETMSVGESIQFIVEAYDLDATEEQESVILEDSITFSIVGKIVEDNKPKDNSNEFNKSNESTTTERTLSETNSNKSSSSQISGVSSSNKSSLSDESESVTYNGSSNNYLNSLEVDGFNFTKDFKMENTTYFVTVPSETTNVNITAVAQESSSTICIYGNENLTSGTNKVLVSVTSEDGSVRIYRIYLTVE